MKPIFFLISVLVSLSISVRAHSQIELFGMSWGKSNKELVEILVSSEFVQPSLFGVLPLTKPSEKYFCLLKENNEVVALSSSAIKCDFADKKCQYDKCFSEKRYTDVYGGADYLDFTFKKKNKLAVNTKEGALTIYCNLFNGCAYSDQEIAQFVLDSVGTSLEAEETGRISMKYDYDKGYCGRGKKGDEVCVKDQTITLYRGSYGTGGMTLSLN